MWTVDHTIFYLGWGVLVLGFFACNWVMNRDIRKERAVSRKSMKTRHKQVREQIEDIISLGIESAILRGELTPKDAEFHYKQLEKAGYKGLGSEPTYGKPWYKKVTPDMVRLKNKLVTLRKRKEADPEKNNPLSEILKRHRKPA